MSITRIVRVDQREQLCGHLAGEVARSRWELDDEVVDGAEVIEGCLSSALPFLAGWAVSLLAGHCDAESLLGCDEMVGVFCVLAEVDLHTQLTVPVKTLLSPS